jgi:hypothetical protein
VDSVLAAFGIKKLSVIIAGAVGGLISLRHYSDLTYKGRVLVVCSSIALANYATPPVMRYFGEAAEDFELGVAAGIGLFGLSIVSSVTNMIKDTDYWKRTIRGFVNRQGDDY